MKDKPLPKPNVIMPMGGETKLTPEKLKAIDCNPIYAGIGPYRRLKSDEEWVRGAVKLIEEDGAEQFLVNLLAVLRPCFAHVRLIEP
jgi:hypothetical protein